MIVRQESDMLVIITQPDHAALAGDIVAAWQADGFADHPLRERLVLATSAHDNGWREPDAAPSVDPASGLPHDFISAPEAVRQRVWPRAVARLAPIDTYAAALVAHHALTVYDRYRGSPAWQAFFVALERARDEQLSMTAPATRRTWLSDYRFLALGDFVSLVFSTGWTAPFHEYGYRIELDGRTVRVTPDPFGGHRVPLRVAARRIPNRRYACDADLRDELARAPGEWFEGSAAGRSS
jgi:hypothetical protein